MLQVFESHAEAIGYDTFTVCSLPYLKQIVQKVKEKLGPDCVPMVREAFKTVLEAVLRHCFLIYLSCFCRQSSPRVHIMLLRICRKLDMML